MKKCPSCQKTYDDDKRFCQTDGTPLIDAAPPPDPYATVVAGKEEIAAAIPSDLPEKSSQLDVASPASDISKPAPDPLGTSIMSSDEMKEMAIIEDPNNKPSAVNEVDFDETIISNSRINSDLSPPVEDPYFSAPQNQQPISEGQNLQEEPGKVSSDIGQIDPALPQYTEKPLDYQSPFSANAPEPDPLRVDPPSPFNEPATPFGQQQYDNANVVNHPIAQRDFTPPPVQSSNISAENVSNAAPTTPATAAKPNQTLAMISLVLGIVSIPCCGFIIFGIGAMITGFLAKNKAEKDPSHYGGKNLALAGLGIGALTTLIGIVGNALALMGVIPIPRF